MSREMFFSQAEKSIVQCFSIEWKEEINNEWKLNDCSLRFRLFWPEHNWPSRMFWHPRYLSHSNWEDVERFSVVHFFPSFNYRGPSMEKPILEVFNLLCHIQSLHIKAHPTLLLNFSRNYCEVKERRQNQLQVERIFFLVWHANLWEFHTLSNYFPCQFAAGMPQKIWAHRVKLMGWHFRWNSIKKFCFLQKHF